MEVKVSILTTAYNHAPYIAQALDSFLMQKTNFPFEIIVHDDASTDGTADIIQTYASKYPDKIRAIFQKENQYSKGINVYQFMIPCVHGTYLAICEGDDFWCDENKLQLQADWLDQHPQYSACVHNTKRIDLKNQTERIWFPCDGDNDLSIEQVLAGGSACFHNSSLMWRKSIQIPEVFSEVKNFGDYVLAICLAMQGKIRYFSRVMSVYRYFTPSSWSMRQSLSSEERIKRCQDNWKLMKIVNNLTDNKYAAITDEIVKKQKFCIYEETGQYEKLKQGKLKALYQKLPLRRRLNILAKQYAPGPFRLYKKIVQVKQKTLENEGLK